MSLDGEGVIYALSEAAANQEMGTRCGSDGDDLVLLNEQEEPTEVCSTVWETGLCVVHCAPLLQRPEQTCMLAAYPERMLQWWLSGAEVCK
jgi:hypothetical protein